jgi:rod shape-determining protein MreC
VLVVGGLSYAASHYNIHLLGGIGDITTYPFQKSIQQISGKINGVWVYFKDLDTLHLENERLRKENDRFLYENTILEQYRDENNELKSLLEIRQRYEEYPTKGASVIGKEEGNWYNIFRIDKGVVDDMKENDVILADGGLAGHVFESNIFSSTVISIIDDRSYVSAKVVRTGDVGILRGDIELTARGMCKMELDIESQVVKGDQIITSHLSDVYPPGIPIGVVEEVITGKNGLTQIAYIQPFVDFKHLTNVLVIERGEK